MQYQTSPLVPVSITCLRSQGTNVGDSILFLSYSFYVWRDTKSYNLGNKHYLEEIILDWNDYKAVISDIIIYIQEKMVKILPS